MTSETSNLQINCMLLIVLYFYMCIFSYTPFYQNFVSSSYPFITSSVAHLDNVYKGHIEITTPLRPCSSYVTDSACFLLFSSLYSVFHNIRYDMEYAVYINTIIIIACGCRCGVIIKNCFIFIFIENQELSCMLLINYCTSVCLYCI